MSPDLVVTITARSMDVDAARQIEHSAWPSDALPVMTDVSPFSRWLGNGTGQGELCIGAHDILDDKADWNASTWLFDPAQIHRFVATLQRLFELLPEEFELVAAWAGDELTREQPITRSELLRIVRRMSWATLCGIG
jgi:hypothetical protein